MAVWNLEEADDQCLGPIRPDLFVCCAASAGRRPALIGSLAKNAPGPPSGGVLTKFIPAWSILTLFPET